MNSNQLPSVVITRGVGKATDVVVGLLSTQGELALVGVPTDLAKAARNAFGRPLLDVAVDLGAKTKPEHAVTLPLPSCRLVVLGLGNDPELSTEQLRSASAAALRFVGQVELATDRTVAISLDLSLEQQLQAVAEGALLGASRFGPVKPSVGRTTKVQIICDRAPRGAEPALDRAGIIAGAVCRARDWVNTPANELYPESFAAEVVAMARGTRIQVQVLDEKTLAKQGFGGILAVGGGSDRPPRLVRCDYHPSGAKRHLVLVGKGITFDTGGYNLKPGTSMITMLSDMAGAAAVLSATRAIADLGLPLHVTSYAPMAESMVSGRAFRPSDVLTMYDGSTVLNCDSDAEGRLILADALARANEDEPDLVVDIATLTGACQLALGTRISGLMASDDDTADLLLDAAEAGGEAFWQLPVTDHLRSTLESKIADLKSKGPREGGAMVAAAFLQHFVRQGTPWAHVDIAGTAFNEDVAWGNEPLGGTGVGVRTLIALARAYAAPQ